MAGAEESSTLELPGGSLYYEVRGEGPLLLIIPGGPQDAGVFSELARQLAAHFRVVAFDPRGNSRSRGESAEGDLDLDMQADDAAALIGALGDRPAYVFGTSGGAHIALNLAVRHPELVQVVAAHEPPSIMMLEDPEPALQADRELHALYRREGVEAAMQKFFADNGLGEEPGAEEAPAFDMPPEAAETFERVSGNFEYWLAHGMLPLATFRPDVEALRSGPARVVIGLGEQSVGQPIHAMGTALAARLGSTPAAFPGDHMGFESHTEAFAETLHRTFSGA